jgi:hypothetical protein
MLEKLAKMKLELVLDAKLTEFLNGNDKAAI